MAGLMDMFRPSAKQPAPQNNNNGNNQQQPNQQQTQQNPAGKANEPGNINNPGPTNNAQNAQNGQENDPFARYSKMWDTPDTEANTPPSFNLDPKVLTDVASSQDFMKGVPPELMQRATSGDTSALMEIIHHSTRNAYRSAIEHGGLLTDKFVGAREAHSAKGLGSRVKEELTTQELSNTPNFKHPVVQRQLKEVATRLSVQHPDASPSEIAEMSRDYLTQLAGALNPQTAKDTANNGKGNNGERGEAFWDEYFQGESN